MTLAGLLDAEEALYDGARHERDALLIADVVVFLNEVMFDGSGGRRDSWYCIGCGARQDYPPNAHPTWHRDDCKLVAMLKRAGWEPPSDGLWRSLTGSEGR